jgi:hypothetical protein
MALRRTELTHALLDHLQAQLGDLIRTYTQIDVGGDSIPRAKLPLLVLRSHGGEAQVASPYEPPEWRIRYSIVIYDLGSPTDTDPDLQLEVFAGAVEAALERKSGDPAGAWWTTLGGKCFRAYPVSEALDAGEPGALKIAVIGVELVAFPPERGVPPPL